MRLEIVVDGGLKSCCSTYPTDFVRQIITDWMKALCEVSVVDAQQDDWSPDEPASKAVEYFGEKAYPFVYIDDTLMAAGVLPDKEQLTAMLADDRSSGITTADIIEAARQNGMSNPQEAEQPAEHG